MMASRRLEQAFLPAALEVEHTPPRPLARCTLWGIVVFFVVALAWACIGRVDIVAVAHGRVVPSARVKLVQPRTAGTVRAIHVGEGSSVEAGELLVELDDTELRAERARIAAEHRHAEHDRARLQALLARLATLPPQEERLAPELRARVASAYEAFAAERRALEDAVTRAGAEQAARRAQLARIDSTLPLLSERAAALARLEARALAPRSDWLELEEARLARLRERDVLAAELAVARAARAEAAARLAALVAATATRWRDELAASETRLESAGEELRKLAHAIAAQRLLAPVAGTVQQLAVHTVGGVVTPAETLMVVVPGSAAVEVEAWVENKDVGFVRVGQHAVVKVETFPFTRYGTLGGRVATVSHDAVGDDEHGLAFLARVALLDTALGINGVPVALRPGMAVTVEVDLGRRRIIEFLLAPLLRYRDEGLTER